MSRRVRHAIGVSLFPFLAVLICIMGALVVLLVLMVARVGTEAVAAEPDNAAARAAAATEEKVLRERLEDARWRRETLETQRTEKTNELANGRDKLAHLERHIRELEDRARALLARAKEIDHGSALRNQDLAAARVEAERLHLQIVKRKSELDVQRKEQAAKERSYALIPYDGPNGTRRRPIYIECTEAGIVLQPEGVVFRPDDFHGPMDPGNPLDAALRTVREHMQRTAGAAAGSPYPLLVVRPSGVVAYGAARSAMRAWDDEFGYELISEDKQLEFGQTDRALSEQLDRAVATARKRQAALALAMPRRYQGDEPLASFSPDDLPGAGGGSGGTGGFGSSGTGGLPSSIRGGRSGGTGGFAAGGQSGRSTLSGPGSPANLTTAHPTNQADESSGPSLGSPTGSAVPDGAAGGVNPGPVYPSTGQPGPYATHGSAGAGRSTGPSAPLPPGAAPLPGGQAVASVLGKPATGDPNAAPGSAGQPGQRRSGGITAGHRRGSNWGLPGAAGRATAITRPIHVAVLADRFVLVPDAGDERPPQQQRISPQLTQTEVDAFVRSVQKEMNSWGLAVEGGFWKPVLDVEVAPDAEHQFADLQTALQNSGFELQRKVR